MPWTFYNASGQKLSSKGKVPVADLANGTDGELITWGTDAVATTVAAGTSGHVLTSGGADAVPAFAARAGVQTAVITGSRPADTDSGNETITGAGFTPTAVIALTLQDGADSASWGFADDAAAEMGIRQTSSTVFDDLPSDLINVYDGSGGHVARVTSYNDDGCVLAWTKTSVGAAIKFHLLFFR